MSGILTPITGSCYFVDSVNGNDANSGKWHTQAWRSIAKLPTSTMPPNSVIFLRRGSYWREELNAQSRQSIFVCSYGEGSRPILDAADVVPNSSFTSDATQTNTYTTSWSVAWGTGNDSRRISVWENGERLRRATSAANCNSTPGSFFANFPSPNVAQTIYVNPTTGSGAIPNNGKTYEISKREWGLCLGDKAYVAGIRTQRNGNNNGSLEVGHDGIIDDCLAMWGTKHLLYIRSGKVKRTTAYRSGDSDCLFFIAFSPDRPAAEVTFEECTAIKHPSDPGGGGWYAHGSGGGYFRNIRLERCRAYNFNTNAYGFSGQSHNFYAIDCYAENCTKGFQPQAGFECLLERCTVKGIPGLNSTGFDLQSAPTTGSILRNCITYGNMQGAVIALTRPYTTENCIFTTTNGNTIALSSTATSGAITIRKTIVFGHNYLVNLKSGSSKVLEDNVYFSSSQNRWVLDSSNYGSGFGGGVGTFADWKAAVNTDSSSINQNPLFLGVPDTGDMRLQSNSPALPIGAGLNNYSYAIPPSYAEVVASLPG